MSCGNTALRLEEKRIAQGSRKPIVSKSQPDSIEFNATLERSDNKLWSAHVRVPDSVAKHFPDVESRRIVCTLNGSTRFQTAILPYRKGLWVIRVNKTLVRKLKVEFGEEIHVVIHPDESAFGLPLPEEFEELLLQDAEGKKWFDALTPGKQRTLLYIVDSVKSTEKRIARGLAILRHLKANKGVIDYKKLDGMIRRQTV